MVKVMTQIADYEAIVKKGDEHIASNMCAGCLRHSEVDGWKLIGSLTPSVEPCDWCNPETSVDGFAPPYVVPNYPTPAEALDEHDCGNVVDAYDYFTPPWVNQRTGSWGY